MFGAAYRAKRKIDDVKLNLKSRYQRATKGYADYDVRGLDTALSTYIVATVGRLREITHGHPVGLTEKRWNKILGQIVDGFQAYLTWEEDWDRIATERGLSQWLSRDFHAVVTPEDKAAYIIWKRERERFYKATMKKFDKAFKLLHEHFESLWD